MAPPNPKRPPRPRGPLETPPPRKTAALAKPELELPFDDADVTPLRADDPRPQRVTQYPTGIRPPVRRTNAKHVSTEVFRVGRDDRELAPRYEKELSNPGFSAGFLYVERGPGQGQLMPVNQGLMILGRSSSADLRLQHPSISRKHAELTRKGERFFLKDCQSQNGTFVNKLRLTHEVELFAGDQLTLGTAFLRLRSANTPGEVSVPTQSSDAGETPSATFFQPGVAKIAIFAGAVGFGLASVLMIAVMRLEGEKPVPPAILEVSAFRLLNEAPAPAPRSLTPAVAVPAPTAPTSLEPVEAPLAAISPRVDAVPTPALTHHTTRHPAPKRAAQVRVANVESEPASVPASESGDANVKARYEQGNVIAALELARKSHSGLVPRLSRFKSSYDQAQKALSGKDTAAAKGFLKSALAADEGISNGWGTYNAQLKRDLVALNQAEGSRTTTGGSKRKSYDEASGDRDSPAPAAESKLAAKTTHKAAIDDAWGDDNAPAKSVKTAAPAKKKSASAAIDAAFGD